MTTGLKPSVYQTKTKIAMSFYLMYYVLEKKTPRNNLVNIYFMSKIYKLCQILDCTATAN